MILRTAAEYEKEIARIQASIDSAGNEFDRRDYTKQLRKVKRKARNAAKEGAKHEI